MERVSRLTILGGGLSISSSSNELIGDALTLPNILFSLSLLVGGEVDWRGRRRVWRLKCVYWFLNIWVYSLTRQIGLEMLLWAGTVIIDGLVSAHEEILRPPLGPRNCPILYYFSGMIFADPTSTFFFFFLRKILIFFRSENLIPISFQTNQK